MRIGIDARLILYQRRGGANYIYNLIKNLLSVDKDNEYVLLYNFFRGANKKLIKELTQDNVRNKVYRIPNRLLSLFWDNFNFPSINLIMGKLDIFHIPYCHQIPPLSGKLIVTIHDLIPIRLPQYYSENELNNHRNTLKNISQKASLIITVSDSTKNDILEFMDIKEERVKVIPEAVGNNFHPIDDKFYLQQIKEKYGIRKEYILFVGGANASKNLSTAVEAFKIFRKNTNYAHCLVLVGKKTWGYNKIIEHARGQGLEDDIILTDYVSDEDLTYIYNGADLFLFPSLYEGFGLSPLEAMASGTPVVASNVSSIPEVVKDAGILIDPYDKEGIARAMGKILDNKSFREELIKKGLERAKLFSWEACARQTLAAYQEAITH